MRKIVLATRNQGKVSEFRRLLEPLGWDVVSLPNDAPIVVEDGTTFEENALKKARSAAAHCGAAALADDSGLVVDALNGEPGVWSARFAGENATDAENIALLLQRLKDVPDERRSARFTAVLAFVEPSGEMKLVTGECRGVVLRSQRGENGFGYDPVFFIPEQGRTMAELTPEEKDACSHRGKALRALVKCLSREDGNPRG